MSWNIELVSRVYRRVFAERTDEYRMVRWVSIAEVSGWRLRSRPRLGWMANVNVALGSRGITMEAA